MSGTALWARLRTLGPAAKVAVATTAAVLTLTTAVAAAVVLPSGGGDSHSAAIQTSAAFEGSLLPVVPTSTPGVQAGAEASLPASPASTSVPVDARAGATVSTPLPSIPLPSIPVPTVPTSIPVPGGVVPDLSGLADIPAKVMDCLAPILTLATGIPSMSSMTQIMQIGPTIVNCVTEIVGSLPLPFGLNACISAIMGFVSGMTSQLPSGTGLPGIGNLNVAACIPSGLPVPTGLTGSGFPFRL
ncbi:MAG: hypothetical protein ACRD12_14590 [Acidimicrobiales bacterium]